MAKNIVDEIAPEPEETETAEAAEPEPSEPESQEQETPQKPERTVPLAALHEERTRRQELQSSLQEMRDKVVRMETLFQRLQEQQKPAPGQTIPIVPRYEDDPEGYYRGTIAGLTQRLESLEKGTEERRNVETVEASSRQLLERYAASVSAFSRGKPDFQDAYAFLGKAVDDDLKARGFDDPAERTRVLQYEEGVLVGRALKAGRDPAEVIYNYAKSRGYAPAAEATNANEETKLEQIKKGTAAAKSLAGPKGKTEGSITLERLAELADEDPAEFDKQWERARRQGILG